MRPSAERGDAVATVYRLSRSWVFMYTVRPSVPCSVLISASKSPAAIGSSPDVGFIQKYDFGVKRRAPGQVLRVWSCRPTTPRVFVGINRRKPNHIELGKRHLVHQPLRDFEILAHGELRSGAR